MDKNKINSRTLNNKDRIKQIIEYTDKLTNDPKKNERLEKQECQYCFYSMRGGGQAFTASKCEECEKEMLFSSTNMDKYCLECAKKNDICKHCGGDINTKLKKIYKNKII